jgi:hypothetical protein
MAEKTLLLKVRVDEPSERVLTDYAESCSRWLNSAFHLLYADKRNRPILELLQRLWRVSRAGSQPLECACEWPSTRLAHKIDTIFQWRMPAVKWIYSETRWDAHILHSCTRTYSVLLTEGKEFWAGPLMVHAFW